MAPADHISSSAVDDELSAFQRGIAHRLQGSKVLLALHNAEYQVGSGVGTVTIYSAPWLEIDILTRKQYLHVQGFRGPDSGVVLELSAECLPRSGSDQRDIHAVMTLL